MTSLVRSVHTARAFLVSLTLVLMCVGPSALAAPAPTTTNLTLSSASVPRGTAVTLTATVTSIGIPIMPGQVYFCNAAVKYCEDINVLGMAQLTSNGTAAIKLILGIGDHNIQAVFHGTNSFAPSQSAVQMLSVTGLNYTTTTIEATGSPAAYTLTATVSAYSKTAAPTGTVSFLNQTDGDRLIGSAQLGNGSTTNPLLALPATRVKDFIGPITVGDFNQDGKLDVAAITSSYGNAGSVSILLGNGDGTFTERQVLPFLTEGGGAIVVGDFNNDGKLDLAIASTYATSPSTNAGILTILLGNGDGTFTTTVSTLPAFNYGLVIGDFNGDGNSDLVLVIPTTCQIDVLLGKGDGTFAALPPRPGCPVRMAAGDFNGDGKLDLALLPSSNVFTGDFTVIHGNGDGTFDAGTTFGVPGAYQLTGILVADVNGDGKPDLIASDGIRLTMNILLNNGNGSFVSLPSISGVVAQAAGDFNGDGVVDFLVGDRAGLVTFYLGKGDGTFDVESFPQQLNGSGAFSLVIADFNGDGLDDVAVGLCTSYSALEVLVHPWITEASAVLDDVTFPVTMAQTVYATFPGDVKNAASSSGTVTLQGDGVQTATTLSVSPGLKVAPGENVRLVATVAPLATSGESPTGTVTFYDGTTQIGSSGVINNQAALTTGSLSLGLHAFSAVYSGDGYFYGSTSPGVILTVVQASTTTLVVAPATVAAGGTVVFTATVTSNGSPVTAGAVIFCKVPAAQCEDLSIVGTAQVGNGGTATLPVVMGIGSYSIQAVFQGIGTGLGASASSPQTLTVTGLYPTTTNFGRSGGPDTYTVKSTITSYGGVPRTGTVNFRGTYLGNPFFLASVPISSAQNDPSFVRVPQPPLPTNFQNTVVASGDFNGDGRPDLAIVDVFGEVIILLGKGDGTFTQGPTYAIGQQPIAIVTGDFNRDGKTDLAVTASNNEVHIFLGNGDGSFTSAPIVPGGVASVIADFNQDGKLDLAGCVSGTINVFPGNGDGTFAATPAATGINSCAGALATGDFNRDGIPDLAVASCCNYLWIMLGKGDGTFSIASQAITGSQQNAIVAGDFNGDGITDLAVANYNNGASSTVSILLGKGDGTFAAGPSYATDAGPDAIIMGDINGDGKPDLVVRNSRFVSANLLLGNGDGTFASTIRGVGPFNYWTPSPYTMVSADFNGDGLSDVVLLGASQIYGFLTKKNSTLTLNNLSFTGGWDHFILASYTGDTHYAGSNSPLGIVPGTGIATTTSLTISPASAIQGQPVQFTVHVSSGSSSGQIPTGRVDLAYGPGGLIFGSITLSNGQGVFTASNLKTGTFYIRGNYRGDANFLATLSDPVWVTINPRP